MLTQQQINDARQKLGIPETGISSVTPTGSSLLAKLQGGEQTITEPQSTETDGVTGLQGFGTGIVKGIGSTITGLGTLVNKGLSNLPGKAGEFFKGGADFGEEVMDTTFKAQGTAEKIGKGVEQIAEFFIPASKVAKVEALLGQKIPNALIRTGAKSTLRAAESGGVATAQSGGFDTGAGIATGIGAVSPILSAGIKLLKPAVAPVLEFTSGVPKQAITKAMSGDEAVKLGMKMTTEEVRDKALQVFKGLDSTLKSDFSKTIDELSKLSPRAKPARTAAIEGTPGVFSGVKGEFKDIVEKSKTSIPNILRDMRISVTGGKLNFNKLNSSIVSPAEQKQLQAVYDTIRNQTDFSVKGVQDVASRINALSKIDTLKGTITSVPITRMHEIYDNAITKVYPDLGKLRSNYATTKKVLGEISNVIGTGAQNPTQIQSAISKLTNLYKTDKQTYLNVIEELSKRSGVDISGLLAGTEFNRFLPDFIRGIGGGGALAASATFLNPLIVLLFPLFSPKLVGKMLLNAPKLEKVVDPTRRVITGAASQIE